jgi:hypothetical protein
MYVWIIATFLSFVTQCSLILIFLEIGKKNPFKPPVDDRQTLMTAERTTSYKTFKLSFKESAESAMKHSSDGRETALNENDEMMPEYRDKSASDDVGLSEEIRLTMQLNENMQTQMQDEVLQNIVSTLWKQDTRKTAAFVKAARFQTIANPSGQGKQ